MINNNLNYICIQASVKRFLVVDKSLRNREFYKKPYMMLCSYNSQIFTIFFSFRYNSKNNSSYCNVIVKFLVLQIRNLRYKIPVINFFGFNT